MYRTLSFVDHFTLNFSGNVSPNAVCLGDLDNDGDVELIVGNSAGELAIYKEANDIPWRVCSDLGQVTCLGVGNILNEGHNVLVVINAEGWCFIFDTEQDGARMEQFQEDEIEEEEEEEEGESGTESRSNSRRASSVREDRSAKSETPDLSSAKNSTSQSPELKPNFVIRDGKQIKMILPFFKQRIPPNAKELIIFDVNNDGLNELVLALTDRVVRSYQWQDTTRSLTCLNKWEFGHQVGSISQNINADKTNSLIVAQPGGALLMINCKKPSDYASNGNESPEELLSKISDLNYDSTSMSRMKNVNVSSEIQGGIKVKDAEPGQASPYAIATLEGNIILSQDGRELWDVDVKRQLFCIRRCDINEDGNDEIVVSSWTGHTYIVTQAKQVTEFCFEESITAFTCGRYTIDGETVAVLVYVTFGGKIFIYYNLIFVTDPIVPLNVTRDDDLVPVLNDYDVSLKAARCLSDLNSFLLYDLPKVDLTKKQEPEEEEDRGGRGYVI